MVFIVTVHGWFAGTVGGPPAMTYDSHYETLWFAKPVDERPESGDDGRDETDR